MARRIGYQQLRMTMRYTQVGDREAITVAETIEEAISRVMCDLG